MTVGADDSLQTAMDLLRRYNIRELPVVDHGKLVGIVTDRDLRLVAPSYPLFRDQEEIRRHLMNLKVASAMTPDPFFVSPDTTLVEAAGILRDRRIGALPVLEGQRLVGIISVTDILDAFIDQNEG